MTDKVRADLVLRAMQLLVPLADKNYAATDLALIDGNLEPLIATLNADRVTYIGDTDSYPVEQFLDLAVLLADACLDDFGLAAMPQQTSGLRPSVERSTERLRRMNAGEPSGAVQQAEYF